MKLYKHQEEALKRMKKMDREGRGGVLAFEPGLGKTLTMITHLSTDKKGTNLVISPVAVLDHWKSEIEKVNPGNKILVYHGNKRNRTELYSQWDYILTTYDIAKQAKATTKGMKYELDIKIYNCIVLDEAHVIRNGLQKKSPKVCKAIYSYRSKKRWCLTGTPINNRTMDLAALAKFLQTPKFTDKKGWHTSWNVNSEEVQEWCDKYMIVENKSNIMKPPKYHDIVIKPKQKENELIDALRDVASKKFDEWMESEKEDRIKKQAQILALIMKMRQCSDSYHVLGNLFKEKSAKTLEKSSSKVEKTIEIIKKRLTFKRENVSGPKDPSNSIVVFSQFTRYLKLLKKVLLNVFPEMKEDENLWMYTGSTSKSKRDTIVNSFTSTSTKGPKILLISLFSGGVGLNLKPCASIILSEPWYNPFIEKQAEDRVHRLGQDNQVNVYRLTIDNSVEKWIQGIKLKKLNIVSDINVFSGSMSNIKIGGMSSATFKMDDLQNLFSKHVAFTSSVSKDDESPSMTRDSQSNEYNSFSERIIIA